MRRNGTFVRWSVLEYLRYGHYVGEL